MLRKPMRRLACNPSTGIDSISADIFSFEWSDSAMYFLLEHMLYYKGYYERVELLVRCD